MKLDRLERSNAAPKTEGIAKSTFVSSQTHDQMYEKKLNFKQDIDVRGMRGDEALQAITYFVDDAILVGMDRVRIFTEQEPEYSVHSSANTCPPYRASVIMQTSMSSSEVPELR